MAGLEHLERLVLEPVIELEPLKFATRRQSPARSGAKAPHEWDKYWLASMADSGITGLKPIRPGSWHVPTRRVTDLVVLERIVRRVVESWGGADALTEHDADPVLSGGVALLSGGNVILEPMCCCDLRNLSDWREVAEYRGADWHTLWIGHPWISVRFDRSSLVLSDLHESDAPVARYSLSLDDAIQAIAVAAAELESFSRRVAVAVEPLLGGSLAPSVGRRLAGLTAGDAQTTNR